MLKGLSENRAREARWAGGTIFHCGGIQTVSSALMSEGCFFLFFFFKKVLRYLKVNTTAAF